MTLTTAVVRATGTAISRKAALAAISAVALAGCGSGSKHDQFSWLSPGSAPAQWHTVSIPNGAAFQYPPGWRRVHGDAGTATAILYGQDRRVLGYLNVTPRQGAETLSNWASFRTAHDADEGDRAVTRLQSGTGLRFRNGHGSCVRDSYTTNSGAHYVELACIVAGQHATTVIVGASPPEAWPRMSPLIERSISAFTS